MELLWESTGWAGAAAILSGGCLHELGKGRQGLPDGNLLGACAFIVTGAFHEAWPSVATNVAWFFISAIALLRMRSASQPPMPTVEAPHVQFPGVPDTTGQLAVVEVLTRSDHGDVDGHRPLN
jgi:hypothetical protein